MMEMRHRMMRQRIKYHRAEVTSINPPNIMIIKIAPRKENQTIVAIYSSINGVIFDGEDCIISCVIAMVSFFPISHSPKPSKLESLLLSPSFIKMAFCVMIILCLLSVGMVVRDVSTRTVNHISLECPSSIFSSISLVRLMTNALSLLKWSLSFHPEITISPVISAGSWAMIHDAYWPNQSAIATFWFIQ